MAYANMKVLEECGVLYWDNMYCVPTVNGLSRDCFKRMIVNYKFWFVFGLACSSSVDHAYRRSVCPSGPESWDQPCVALAADYRVQINCI